MVIAWAARGIVRPEKRSGFSAAANAKAAMSRHATYWTRVPGERTESSRPSASQGCRCSTLPVVKLGLRTRRDVRRRVEELNLPADGPGRGPGPAG